MMNANETYVEDEEIVLPNLVGGPTAIGDLWDCQNSRFIGLNLFGKTLDSQYLHVDDTKDLKYTLTHVRSIMDRHKLLQVSGEVLLELLAGFIKVDGESEFVPNESKYDSDKSENDADEFEYFSDESEYPPDKQFHTSEELLCHYDLKTFSVKALPAAKEVVDSLVKEKLLKGEIKATHVVIRTILGAEVMASIRLRQTKLNSNEDVTKNFCGKFTSVPITASAKVALEKLDTRKCVDFEKYIKVDSKPSLNLQPVTILEMFQFIESIGKRLEENKQPALVNAKDYVNSDVLGVPLRFYMIPITHLLDVPVKKLYIQIKDDVRKKLIDTLVRLTDFQIQGHLKKRILENEPQLKSVLLDQKNPLVVKVSHREKEIRSLAKACYSTVAETLKEYKMGKFDKQHLLRIVNGIDRDINITSVFQEIHKFTSEGQMEFLGMHNEDIDGTRQLKIFTNTTDIIEWYQTQEPIKVLLRTGGNCVHNGHATYLYDISRNLEHIGVEVGIASPIISDGRHDLSIKIDDSEVTYSEEDISFVIKVLLMLVNQADQTSTRLFTIYAAVNGVKLPFQTHLFAMHSMISILSEIRLIKIADSYMKLQDFALKNDGRWKFVMDLNAFDSAEESVNKFRYLNVELSELALDWIVGSYGFESSVMYSNAPLLFIFKDGKLQALCFDNIDILLLVEAFKPEGERYFKVLYPDEEAIKKGLHKSRIDFALKIVQLFQNKRTFLETESNVSKIGGFSSPINKNVEAIQILVRSFLGNDDISLWRAMANIVVHDLPDAETILNFNTWIQEVNDYASGFENVYPQALADVLKEFFAKKNPFYSKIHLVLGSIICCQTSEKKKTKAVEGFINNLTDDANCPKQLTEQLIACQEIHDYSNRFEMVEKILKEHLETVKGSKFETIALFIQLLEIPVENLEDFFAIELLPKLVARLDVDSKYPTFHAKLLNLVEAHNFYLVLRVLAQIQYEENHLFLVCNELESLTRTTDTGPLCQLLGKFLVDKLSVEHYRWLFANPKFICLLEINLNCNQLMQNIKIFHCLKLEVPDYIPQFLREKLQTMMKEDDVAECPDVIQNVDQAVSVFQHIASQNCIPDKFSKVLSDSVTKRMELKTALESANALFYWSEEGQLFAETWTCETISRACKRLIDWKQSLNNLLALNEQRAIPFDFKIGVLSQPNEPSEDDLNEKNLGEQNEVDGVSRTQAWRTLLGSCAETFSPRNFLKIQRILAEPSMGLVFEGFIAKLLPYIVQRLKMWGINVIQQENLAKMNTSQGSTLANNKCFNKFVFETDAASHSDVPVGSSTNSINNCPIARIDVLACLHAVCHCLVFQDLLRVMSQFPTALPLVLQDLRKNHWDYVCLVPLLKSLSVKWETQPGVVTYNYLFINPYKMIVAFRVGSAKPGCSGKSTVLNQIMGTKHMFSSLGGPGADKGIPVTLQGSTEIAVLLKETCSYALWDSVVQSYYKLGCNEVLMLANVHGDALELPQTFELLKGMATSYIAFFMPCTRAQLQANSMKIQELLNTEDIVYVLVDPTPDCERQPISIINTNQLMLDNTLATIRSVLGAAAQMGSSKTLTPMFSSSNTIRPAPHIFTEESQSLLNEIKKLGCRKARSILQLQKMNPKSTNNYRTLAMAIWQNKASLHSLMTKFAQMLNLPLNRRLLAFTHLDRELSFLTAEESIQIREKLGKLQEQRRRFLNLEEGCSLTTEQKQIIEQIRLTLDELDNMSIGMEHLCRELGRIYQADQCTNIPKNESILSLPKRFAELLICGQAVEILDGDIGDMCGPWLHSICHSVCESYPELRIFTLSIIGLQSSGKSTLLNALFACKFAVSVGRCTRGLFMKLVFMDKILKEELQIDAILLIDTEGLGAPEKLNDSGAEHKDRLLATFAMSVSNLTLINVLGESVRDITDILQIVIVTMARLEKADISPDILIVQHLAERDSSKTMKGADEFCKALEEAVRLTDSKDMALGVRNCKSLRKLEYRMKNGQFLKQFRSFKNGASANAPPSQEYHEDVVDLYKTILNSCKQMTSPQKFHNWHDLIQNYWAAVSTQDFSLRFKNIQEVHEFIGRGNAIAKIKIAVDRAFWIHRESCEIKLRQKVNELGNNYRKTQNWETIKEQELQNVREVLKCIPHACKPSCSQCSEAVHLKNQLFCDLEGKTCQQDTMGTINMYIRRARESAFKHLSQMAEAIRVKHCLSYEIDSIIGNIFMEKVEYEPKLSECERKKMGDEVWLQVDKQIAHGQQVASSKRRICNEIQEEYDQIESVVKHFCPDVLTKEFPDIRCIKAVELSPTRTWKNFLSRQKQDSCLKFQQANFLQSNLDNLPNSVMKRYGADNFEDGMVKWLKADINNVLEKLETIIQQDGTLLSDFKWKVHIYSLMKFTEVMTVKEQKWNGNYNPYFILHQNMDLYLKKIDICIQHGVGFEAEGRIIGELLLKAIRKRGQKQGDRTYIDHICSMSWLTSSENVRLLYFSKLAEQVAEEDNEQAVNHFQNPKARIEAWYNQEVDSVSPEIGMNKFTETVNSELEHVVQEIRIKTNCNEIEKFIRHYLTQVDDIEYNPGVDLASGSESQFCMLQKVILKQLAEHNNSLKHEITMALPSKCLEVSSLLGCTEHCHWCGSLCWGQAGHKENTDSTKKHHACHQPEGLLHCSHKNEHYLFSSSCDSCPDYWTVYWHNCTEGMTWLEAKSHEDFANWTFTPHHKSEFNDLMKWFFLKLHDYIANSSGLLPARHNDLSDNGFFNLPSLDHILATIKSRI